MYGTKDSASKGWVGYNTTLIGYLKYLIKVEALKIMTINLNIQDIIQNKNMNIPMIIL